MTENQMEIERVALTEYLSKNPEKLKEFERDLPTNKRKMVTGPLAIFGFGLCVAIVIVTFGGDNDSVIGTLVGAMLVGAIDSFMESASIFKDRKQIIKNAKKEMEEEA